MITDLTTFRPLVEEDGSGSFDLRDWAKNITDEVNFQEIATGTGSPETVLSAEVTKLYMDDAGTAGNILYIKKLADIAGDDTQGWILV